LDIYNTNENNYTIKIVKITKFLKIIWIKWKILKMRQVRLYQIDIEINLEKQLSLHNVETLQD